MSFNVVLFVGSVRDGRMAERVAKMVQNYLASEVKNVNVTVLDPLKKTYLQAVKQPVHFYSENPPPELVADNEIIKKSDAFIFVSGEYNRCIPRRFGGICSAIQVRQFATELSMVPLSSMVNIGVVQEEIGECGELINTRLKSSLKRTFDQMLWYADALRTARNSGKPMPF